MASTGLGRSRAERVDPVSGIRETAAFVGVPTPMLTFVHRPAGDSRGAVVICSSVYAEFTKNYRREVRLARALANGGIAGIRLHYRGNGNSTGDPSPLLLANLVADISEVVGELGATYSLPTPCFLGTRVGAVVAALAAPADAPLVLWEPVLDGDRWLKDAMRAAKISRVSRGLKDDGANPTSQTTRLEADGVLDLLGFALYRPLIDDVRRVRLEEVLAARRGPTMLIQIGSASNPRPANLQMIDRLRSVGVDVEFHAAGHEVAWWFEEGGARDFESDDEIVLPTVAWFEQKASAGR